MRIIYYSPHPTHDIVSEVGYSTHQREVINALNQLGHDVLPIVMGGTKLDNLNNLATEEYRPSVFKKIIKVLLPRFIWTSLNNFKLLQHDKKAGKILEAEILKSKPDLIYERSEYLQDSGAKMASLYKIQYFIEVNAPFVEEMNSFEGYSIFQKKAHQIESYKIEKANKVFCVSSSLADFLKVKYHCDEKKLVIQPNCINIEKCDFQQEIVDTIRLKYNFNNFKVIGFVGSMFPYHGVDILINAFGKLINKHKHIKLMIVGDGIVLNDLKYLSKSLNLEKDIIFTGKIPHAQVFNYIKVMDICIMANSNWYGSPVKLFEYGLMNKPIIAPNTSPVLDVMIDKVDALLINENESELTLAIESLLLNSEYSENLAKHFHEKVISKYTWNIAANRIIELCA